MNMRRQHHDFRGRTVLAKYALRCIEVFVVLLTFCGAIRAEPISISVIDRTETIDFQKEIVPILQRKCLACHSASERQGELVLETPPMMLKGGDTGPSVVAGKGAESLLLKLASHHAEPFMPPPGNDGAAAPETPQEFGRSKLWIDQGAQSTSQNPTPSPVKWRPLPRGVNPI